MANVNIRRVQVAARSGTGTQDIVINGFGTPVAAMFIFSSATAVDTARADAQMCIGLTDGTNQCCASISSQDAAADSNCGRRFINTAVISQVKNAGGNVSFDGVAAFSAWITDGVRIDWTTAAPAQTLIDVILFNGPGISNAAVTSTNLGTGTSAVNETGPGFQADLVIAISAGLGLTSSPGAMLGVGFYDSVNGTQGCNVWGEDDAAATMTTYSRSTTTVGMMDIVGGTTNYEVTFGSHASGFSVTASANAGSDYIGALSLKWSGSVGTAVFSESTPTAASTAYSKTGLSFKPGFGITLTCGTDRTGATIDTSDADGFSFASMTTQDLCSAISFGQDDAAASSDTSGYVGAKVLQYSGASNGSFLSDATFDSFNADGWTKTQVTNAAGLARREISLAIQANGVGVPLFMHHRMQQGMS